MNQVLIVKYGEIALRGGNRRIFEDKLMTALRKNLNPPGGYSVTRENGRFLVTHESGTVDYDMAVPRLSRIPGLISVCPSVVLTDRSLDSLCRASLEFFSRFRTKEHLTFKVETQRGDKSYPLTSPEVSAEIGQYILDHTNSIAVDVKKPDITLNIEIRNNIYLYTDEIRGQGGLPIGTSGKGMVLLSAGIDSPVAAYMMAKRGVTVEAVYFHSPPYTSERALQKVKDVCGCLTLYTGGIRLHAVPFTEVQLKLKERTPPEKLTILLKRAMLDIAERLARANNCIVLATGDSIGQVASQTLKSIAAVESAVAMPVIRPLACMDKNEITDIARRIGTFEISIRPFDDCCTLFVAKHPETKPKINIIESIWRNIEGLPELLEKAAQEAEVFDI